MRIHLLAMLALLTAAVATGCGSAREVRDATAHSNAWGCDQCHGYPPPPSFPRADASTPTHPAGVTAPMCSVCHPSTVMPDGHTIVAGVDGQPPAHRNGQVEVAVFSNIACDSCHDTPPATGRHVFHVTTRGQACSKCHLGFDPVARTADDTVHMNGQVDLILDDGTASGKLLPAANQPDKDWPESECAACHAALGVGEAD